MTSEKARALTEQIEASVNQLASETDAARQSELFRNWLNTMAQFHRYSWGNQLLIACQRPADSSGQVAGFHTWRKLGRHVKKGAKGIAILAPCVYRRKTDDSEEAPAPKAVLGFRTTYVFSESDTEGRALPTLASGAESGGDELLSRLEWVSEEELDITLSYEDIKEPGVEGYSTGGRIVIRESLCPTTKAGTVVHELAHELLHQQGKGPETAQKSRQQRELEAESVAYVVMRHFGIDHIACNYLATYRVDSAQLKQSLQTISATAKFLIAAIDPQLNEPEEAAADATSDPPA